MVNYLKRLTRLTLLSAIDALAIYLAVIAGMVSMHPDIGMWWVAILILAWTIQCWSKALSVTENSPQGSGE